MESLQKIYTNLESFYVTKADLRTTNLLLMSSPFYVFGTSLMYLVLVKIIVPQYMANRKAFDIKAVLWLFNFWHLSANIYFFSSCLRFGWASTYSWRCEPIDRSFTGFPLQVAYVTYQFLIFKLTDFTETMILLCGNRNELVTKYHIAHHFMMPNMIWFVVKFVPGGHATFFGFVNSFSHIIMYSYLISIGTFPALKKNIPWFRQFRMFLSAAEIIAIVVHTFQLLIKNDCNFPIEYVYYALMFASIYLVLSLFCNDKPYDRVKNEKECSIPC